MDLLQSSGSTAPLQHFHQYIDWQPPPSLAILRRLESPSFSINLTYATTSHFNMHSGSRQPLKCVSTSASHSVQRLSSRTINSEIISDLCHAINIWLLFHEGCLIPRHLPAWLRKHIALATCSPSLGCIFWFDIIQESYCCEGVRSFPSCSLACNWSPPMRTIKALNDSITSLAGGSTCGIVRILHPITRTGLQPLRPPPAGAHRLARGGYAPAVNLTQQMIIRLFSTDAYAHLSLRIYSYEPTKDVDNIISTGSPN